MPIILSASQPLRRRKDRLNIWFFCYANFHRPQHMPLKVLLYENRVYLFSGFVIVDTKISKISFI